jgi:hypothetical protein
MITMSRNQIIYGLESILGKQNHSNTVLNHRITHNETKDSVKGLIKIMNLVEEKGWTQYIASHSSQSEIEEKTNSEYIASLPQIDMKKRSNDIPFGICYGNHCDMRIIIASPAITFYPTDNKGKTIMITDKLPYLSTLQKVEDMLLALIKKNEDGTSEPLSRFDELYQSGIEVSGSEGKIVCPTRIASPYRPVFTGEVRITENEDYEVQMGYSVFGNNGKNIKNSLRVIKLVHR